MDLTLSSEDEAFRRKVRSFLEAEFTLDLLEQAARQAGVFAEAGLAREWHQRLFRKGWVAPAWPSEYGGPGWTLVQRYIYESECAVAGAPVLPAMGLQMCGPVIIGYGSQQQKEFFLPRILSGEHYWCQGYSEPQAGSDLAALQCKAVRDGDHYVLNGTKIWTTHAQWANWIFLLVRTSSEGKPQAGITFLLAPLDSPGITVRPIISMSGEHEVNQVFFDDVRVPVENRVGEENDGWRVAKYLLEFERGGGFSAARILGNLAKIKECAKLEPCGDGTVWDDEAFRLRFAKVEIEATTLEFSQRRVLSALSTGQSVGGFAASMLKLRASELKQKAAQLALEMLGPYALADQNAALQPGSNAPGIGPDYGVTVTAKYLNARAATIFGGSSEIQRNLLARIALGG
ncbi:acyl-CoA dehydrogenase family protein [Marinicaulis aureus]|uniref:Acyl-CoA dehydrogenase family protein n=1 Tax=Hyphococcus aureus TaxID=2666033 RepID=A0ABW1KU11_9PROT